MVRASWAPALVLAAGLGAAIVTNAPSSFFSVLHFLGGAALVFFFSHALQTPGVLKAFGDLKPRTRLLFSFCAACTLAVAWEIGEFTVDSVAGTHLQEGQEDTMTDLIYGVSGAAAWVGVLLYKARAQR